MSYFDDELIKDLSKHSIGYAILSEAEHASIVNEINEKAPFSGSKIDWRKLKNSINFESKSSEVAILRMANEIKAITNENTIFVGDSACDEAYSVSAEDLEKALMIFSELPQHTYIVPKSLTWIACISFEGNFDFASFHET
ncbi:hypothetical protein [Pseudomonas sp.]|uniref:hypothetical protein n=1 Tax=Pseudomonas sp. TaxID=306 RepID=UPI003C3F6419